MVDLAALWLPILLSAIAVFFLSFLMWMVLPHHRSDWSKLPDEDAAITALADLGVKRGQYTFPHMSSPDKMKDPAWVKQMETGPSGMMIIMPTGPMHMGKSMAVSFFHNLVIAVFVAYLAGHALGEGADYLAVFRIAGVAAILGFCGTLPVNAIWFHWSWSSVAKQIFDGVVYGLVTAGFFSWLWP